MSSRSVPFAFLLAALMAGQACHAEPDEGPPMPPRTVPPKKSVPLPPCDANTDPVLTAPFSDNFDRAELGNDWRTTSYGAYFLKNARLCISKPRNHPVWLKRKLPTNVRVEFEAIPLSNNADVKTELFGDGCAFDVDGRDYTATAYVAVLGAHNNAEHWLTRLSEHGTDARKTPLIAGGETIANSKLLQNKPYKVEMSRTNGKELRFVVDGTVVHTFDDAQPLMGAGHDHFAFNGWDAPVCFDKLVITPLP